MQLSIDHNHSGNLISDHGCNLVQMTDLLAFMPMRRERGKESTHKSKVANLDIIDTILHALFVLLVLEQAQLIAAILDIDRSLQMDQSRMGETTRRAFGVIEFTSELLEEVGFIKLLSDDIRLFSLRIGERAGDDAQHLHHLRDVQMGIRGAHRSSDNVLPRDKV